MPRASVSERPPYAVAGGITAAILLLYVVTIAPTTQFWDTSEYISAAKVLGIPHPPGNPLFVLLASVWGMIPLAGSYALRINLFAAVTSALSSGLLFLVADRFLCDTTTAPRWARLSLAAAGILVGATSFTVWNQSTVNEKVYTLSLLSIALVLWIAVHWGDDEDTAHRDRWLILVAFLLSLTATNHLMGLLVLPAVLAYILFTDPLALTRWRVWLGITCVILVGVSVWAFLPIRAAHFPPINEGEPTSWDALISVINREQYAKPPLDARQAPLASQLANYWQYFSWQFGHDWPDRVQRGLAVVFLSLGLVGGIRQWQRDRRGALAMTALIGTLTFVLVFYLNFKYGFSISPDLRDVVREVRERDYFFVASFLVWGVWVALGLAVAMEWVGDLFEARLGPTWKWKAALPVLAVALVPVAGNRLSASRAGETMPRDFAVDLLESVEPYGILITAGDNDTFPLWYAQEVEGVRKDVLLANQSLMNTDWHLRQMKRRPIYAFDSATAAPIYRGHPWQKPEHEPLGLSFAELDQLPPAYQVAQPSVFQVGKVRAYLQPGELLRSDLATLQLLRDNLGKRPIYFSRTTGPYADDLGLTGHLMGHGLARKLTTDSIVASDSTQFVPSLGWVDLKRSRALLFDAYHAEAVARQRPLGWPDVPSEGIMVVYWVLYSSWAEMLRTGADSAAHDAERLKADDLARRILAQTSIGRAAGKREVRMGSEK